MNHNQQITTDDDSNRGGVVRPDFHVAQAQAYTNMSYDTGRDVVSQMEEDANYRGAIAEHRTKVDQTAGRAAFGFGAGLDAGR